MDQEDVSIATAAFEQFHSNFRHWDQIRWLAPYWFVTLYAGTAAIVAGGQAPPLFVIAAGFFLAAFSGASVYLMHKTICYHNDSLTKLQEVLASLELSPLRKKALEPGLPFKLEGKALRSTATFWFMILISFMGAVALVAALIKLVSI